MKIYVTTAKKVVILLAVTRPKEICCLPDFLDNQTVKKITLRWIATKLISLALIYSYYWTIYSQRWPSKIISLLVWGRQKKNLELGNSSALPKVVSVLIIVSVSI